MANTNPTWRVTLSDIDLGVEEERAVLDVLRGKWLSLGPRTAKFEQGFAEFVGARHAVAVASGTAALHLTVAACGIGPGDEVIVPGLTFVATANAVLYCGGRPVFADVIGEHDLRIDIGDVERKITPATRAVIPMHYGGYPCDMDSLLELAARHDLRVVDDACHAPGARWRGRPIGSLGDASCFSFFANKNLVAGEGGMVTTDDDDLAEAVRRNRSHGMTASSLDKQRGHAFAYDVVSCGYNYRMTEIEAALGLVQLDRLASNNSRRCNIVKKYHRDLQAIDGLVIPFADCDDASAYHLMVVVLPAATDRAQIQAALRERGIQSSVHYPPLHRFTRFAEEYEARLPHVDNLTPRLLTLPLHPLMSDDDVELVSSALAEALRVTPTTSTTE